MSKFKLDKWLGYSDRSFETIMNANIQRMNVSIPEVADNSANNILVRMLELFAGIAESNHYYIDRAAEESFLSTCQLFESAVKIAETYDYRVRAARAASVVLRFTLNQPANQPITIPTGTECTTVEGIPYVTQTALTIPVGSTFGEVTARQWVPVSPTTVGVVTNDTKEVYPLAENVDDASVSIEINSITYSAVDTFAYSTSNDYHFKTFQQGSQEIAVSVGDGISGFRPTAGSAVIATYNLTLGAAGNVAPNLITQISNPPALPAGYSVEVTNLNRASGGVNPESLSELRVRVPIQNKTILRAVTYSDYEVLGRMVTGVAQTAIDFECGKAVTVYVAPTGGGLAPPDLLQDVVDYFENKRMVTTLVVAEAAGEVQVSLEINLQVKSNYSRLSAENQVTTNLVDFGSVENQSINGAIRIGDVYEVVENTTEVAHSEVIKLTAIPYPRPISGQTELLWTIFPKVFSGTPVKFQLKIVSTSGTPLFQLNRFEVNPGFIGQFQLTDPISLPELDFTLQSNSYQVGDTWEFWTYPSNTDLDLQEPSVPVIRANNVTLNITGGV